MHPKALQGPIWSIPNGVSAIAVDAQGGLVILNNQW